MKKLWVLVAALLVTACFGTSQQSQFYTLQPMAAEKAVSDTTLSIGVEEARIARYLDKPQIVLSEESGVEVRVSEINRWAEPLSAMIQRTLVDDLTTFLPNAVIKERTQAREKFDYVVLVEINQMTGQFDETAKLSGWFSIMNADGDIIRRQRVTVFENMSDSYADYATVQSRLFQQMAKRIAQDIATLKK